MHVETSAIVAILTEEPETPDFLARIKAAERPTTSVVNAIEAAISLGRKIDDIPLAGRLTTDLLSACGIDISDLPADLYQDVIRAYARYGKGTGHPARLNFGDCISYAVAKRGGGELLYKGEDFARTDLAAGR